MSGGNSSRGGGAAQVREKSIRGRAVGGDGGDDGAGAKRRSPLVRYVWIDVCDMHTRTHTHTNTHTHTHMHAARTHTHV